MHAPIKLKSKLVVGGAVALAAAAILAACGGGGGADPGGGGGGGGGGGVSTTIAGAISNSPVDGAPVRATCADGTAGGAGVSAFGTYSVSVSCASGNYPIVIAVSGDGSLAGPDMQFATSDDSAYKLAERAPLKVAIESITATSANMTALSTLAAQPIADKIAAVKAAPTTAPHPTANDVLTAETNAKLALGLEAVNVKQANPFTDPQLARVSAQLLEAVAVIKALSYDSAVTPEGIFSCLAQAAQTGSAGGTGTAGLLVKTEADGLKSFDINAAKVALTNAAAVATGASSGPSSSQMAAVNLVLSDALLVEAAIKGQGAEREQVAKVIASVPAMQTFDPAKANLSALTADFNTAMASPTNASGSTAALLAKVGAETLRMAGIKALEIDTSSTIAPSEKASRKRAVFMAAEAIRTATEYEILTKTLAAPLSADETARAFALVSLAVNLAGDLVKAATLGDIIDAALNWPKPSLAALAEKVRLDVASQISGKTKSELGDLKSLNPQVALGAAGIATVNTAATNLLALFKDYKAAATVGDAALRASVVTVVDSMSSPLNLTTTKVNVLATVGALAQSLSDALPQVVTVGAATGVPLSTLSPDLQAKLLTVAAHTIVGPAKLDYSSPPAISTAAAAITSAAYTVGRTVIATKPQSITLGQAPNVAVGTTGSMSATGGASGNALAFSSSTPTTCTVLGGTVTGLGAGDCVIAVNQPGNANYLAAPQVEQTFSIAKGNQTITLGTAPTVAVGATAVLNANGGGSGNPVTYASTTSSVCTVAGSKVTGVSGGVCLILVDQAGNANYNAAPQATLSFSIGLNAQVIKFGTPPNIVVGGSGSLSATGGASGNAVTYSSSTPGVCSVSGSTVKGIAAGSCVIAADQAGNVNYLAAAQVLQTIVVAQATQTITFGTAPTLVVGGTQPISATGGGSGNPVTFGSTTPLVCTVNGGNVKGISAGSCVIAANQAGNANYMAAGQVTLAISIGLAAQSIVMGPVPSIAVGTTGTLAAVGGASGKPVTFSSMSPTTCTVSGNAVTGVNVGTCLIAANQIGDSVYSPAPQVTQSGIVIQGSQAITFNSTPSLVVGGTATLTATGGPSGNPIFFSGTTPSTCTVTGTTITGVTVGNCLVTANQAGNSNYLQAAEVILSINISTSTSSFSGVCQVQFGSAIGYVTNVPSASTCSSATLNTDGYGARAFASPITPPPGSTSISLELLPICDPLGAPPEPTAKSITPCRKQ